MGPASVGGAGAGSGGTLFGTGAQGCALLGGDSRLGGDGASAGDDQQNCSGEGCSASDMAAVARVLRKHDRLVDPTTTVCLRMLNGMSLALHPSGVCGPLLCESISAYGGAGAVFQGVVDIAGYVSHDVGSSAAANLAAVTLSGGGLFGYSYSRPLIQSLRVLLAPMSKVGREPTLCGA